MTRCILMTAALLFCLFPAFAEEDAGLRFGVDFVFEANLPVGYSVAEVTYISGSFSGAHFGGALSFLLPFLHVGPVHTGIRFDGSLFFVLSRQSLQAEANLNPEAVIGLGGPEDCLFDLFFLQLYGGAMLSEFGLKYWGVDSSASEVGYGYRMGGKLLFRVKEYFVGPEVCYGSLFLETVDYSYLRFSVLFEMAMIPN